MPRYYLDLFAGIGGFSLGAYWADMEFDKHYFSEVDPYAISVYRKRFPDAICLGDIKSIGEELRLPHGDWFFSGGFPCQDISIAGKGAGLEGSRSGLWFEYARLIGEIRPKYALIENVGALAVRGLQQVLCSLADVGYDAVWQDIRACDLGAPHRRERIWIIAYPHDWSPGSNHATEKQKIRGGENAESRGICGDVADPGCPGFHQRRRSENAYESGERSGGIFRNGLPGRREEERRPVAYPKEQSGAVNGQKTSFSGRGGETMVDTGSPGLQTPGAEHPATGISGCGEVSDTGYYWTVEWQRKLRKSQQTVRTGENHEGRAQIDEIGKWWAVEPDVCRVADGLPPGLGRYEGRLACESYKRRDQLKGYGNAVVPQIAMMIWQRIKECEEREAGF
jgi:DNA (cytosine-5)-methyltransferase 1